MCVMTFYMIPKSSTCILGRYDSLTNRENGEMNDLNIGVHRQQQARCMLTGVLFYNGIRLAVGETGERLQVDR